ncbi:hypothetical protein CLCR_09358 [Cladophialophora carrionii]|uniref:Uncharacterized protein n=1 Tax=Cladophialophora carrionii TaxID=86049 RepID=A0A1C1CSG6_9EURO|nr:hypothetical protein CLCR_09358 [Cladophialophora carrionii]
METEPAARSGADEQAGVIGLNGQTKPTTSRRILIHSVRRYEDMIVAPCPKRPASKHTISDVEEEGADMRYAQTIWHNGLQ